MRGDSIIRWSAFGLLIALFYLVNPYVSLAQIGFPLGTFDSGLPVDKMSQAFQPGETIQQEGGPLCTFIWEDKCYRGHLGEDWAVPRNTDVYAIAPGTVVYAGYYSKSWGNVIIIQHDLIEGIRFSMYAHLSTILVKDEEEIAVPRAKAIGKSGTAGSGPHLHLEIKDQAIIGRGYSQQPSIIGDELIFDGIRHFRPSAFIANHRCACGISQISQSHPNGTLVKTADDQTIYLLQNGQRRGISSEAILHSLYNQEYSNFNSSDVITISAAEMSSYGEPGPPVSSSLPSNGKSQPDGRLIKSSAPGSTEISIVTDGGKRRSFSSGEVFLAMGLQ
jgi:murein DD-endopeptidase MepM/ murein hydrolase activator NlpD